MRENGSKVFLCLTAELSLGICAHSPHGELSPLPATAKVPPALKAKRAGHTSGVPCRRRRGCRRCARVPCRLPHWAAQLLCLSSLQRLFTVLLDYRWIQRVQQGLKKKVHGTTCSYRPPPLPPPPPAGAPKSSATPAQISWQRAAYSDCTSATPRDRREKSDERSACVRSSSCERQASWRWLGSRSA